jgi:hypothetical protein
MVSENILSYYRALEAGARYLAAQADTMAERDVHLAMVGKYARMRQERAQD